MGAAVPSDDTEAESVKSSFKSDGLILRRAEGQAEGVRNIQKKTAVLLNPY